MRDAAPRHDHCHCYQYQCDAHAVARRQPFAKDGDAKQDGRQRLQCAQDGRRRRADALDGAGGAQEGDGGGEQSEGNEVAPEPPAGRQGDTAIGPQPPDEKQHAEQQDVERHLQRGHLLQAGTVDAHDVDGVGQGRA